MKRITSQEFDSLIEKQSSPFRFPQNLSNSFTLEEDISNKPLSRGQQSVIMISQPDIQAPQKDSNTQFTFEKQCHVCQKQFSLFVNRHHCRWCGHSICKDHGLKTRPKKLDNGIQSVRICDDCDKVFTQNNMNSNLALDNEILKKNINKLKQKLQQKQNDLIDAQMKIKDMESNMNRKENDEDQKEQNIKKLLQEEQMKHEFTRNVTESLRMALEQSQKSEKIAEDLNQRYKAELELCNKHIQILTKENQHLKLNNEKLVSENKYYEKKLEEKEDLIEGINKFQGSSIDSEEPQPQDQSQENFYDFQQQKKQKETSFKDSILHQQKKGNGKAYAVRNVKNESCSGCLLM